VNSIEMEKAVRRSKRDGSTARSLRKALEQIELLTGRWKSSLENGTVLANRVSKLERALNQIACWGDGEKVGSHFDSPGNSETAREALADA